VQVDHLERQHCAPAERVEEHADLDEPELAREPEAEPPIIVIEHK
jgi:hypothetical protein